MGVPARPVFISYSRQASAGPAAALQAALGPNLCYRDETDLRPGEPFPAQLMDAILGCRIFVCFLGDAYLGSWFCRAELRVALEATDQGSNPAAVVMALPPQTGHPSVRALPLGLSHLHWPKDNETDELAALVRRRLEAAELPTLLERLGERRATLLREELERESRLVPRGEVLAGVPVVGLPPAPTDSIYGRATELHQLHQRLRGEGALGRVALVGAGGSGKSRTALEYAWRYGVRDYPGGIFWLNAADESAHLAQLHGVLARLIPDLPPLADLLRSQVDLGARLTEVLQERITEPALWIIDNYPEPPPGQPVAPLSGWAPVGTAPVAVLATSRVGLQPQAATIDVGRLETAEAVALLQRGLGAGFLTDSVAWQVAEAVGGWPLALELLNRGLISGAIFPEDLAPLLAGGRPTELLDEIVEVLRPQVPAGVLRGISESFHLTYSRLDAPAQLLARALAHFAPNTPFPALLIGALPEAAPGPRTTLISRSLVGPPGAGRLGPMHAIAADFLRGQDHDRAGRAAATAALERLRGSYPRPSGQPPEGMDLLLTHLHGYWSNTVDAPAGPIGLWIGRLMKAFGNPVDADRHWGALAEALGRSGVWDVSYWQAELHRSTAESQRDRLPQARDAFAHLWGNPVLAPQEQGAMAHALVGAIADSGDVEGARDFLEPIVEAMAADPDAYGDRRLILMGRLAQYYVRTGERAKAVAMVDSVWGRLQQVELETPELTLLLLENLGIALFELEDMARAKELFARAIKLAPLAIHSLWDQSNLACMMLHIGERVRGMALLKEVFAARVQIFGPHHYNTLVTQLNIGIQERESGNLEAALAVLVPCTEGWLKTTAPDHHACLLARSNVVTTLLALGRPAEAKPWAHELVATAESRWAGAPPTLKYRLLEARCDAALGDPEALSTIRRLKAAVLEALDSADGLVEEAELAEAETLQLQGRHLEAAALLGSLLARLQARLDPWHDERRMVAGMLLRSLIADGQSAEVGALVRGELGWLFEAAPESLTPAERGILTLARRWAEHPSGSNGWSHPGIGLPSIVPPISRTV